MECFTYDAQSGTLRWRSQRPANHFGSERGMRIWQTLFGGKMAGSDHGSGYLSVRVSGRLYFVHRIAFIIANGQIPDGKQIDHVNGVRDDNRQGNLRLADRSENARNAKRQETNTSGRVGVSWCSRNSKWYAYINHRGRMINLGHHHNIDDAVAARLAGEKAYHGRFASSASR